MKNKVYFSSLQKRCEEEILLTQQVYTRLLGLMNLCAFYKGMRKEYGEYIFGYYGKGKIIFCDHNTKVENIAKKAGAWRPSKEMVDEADSKMAEDGFNCFANVHTHPSFTASGMAFSDKDIDEYQRERSIYNVAWEKGITKKPIRTFGCMMSLGPRQYDDDAIAFVSWENDCTELVYYPNISIIIDDEVISLKEASLPLYVDRRGKPYLRCNSSCEEIVTVKRNIMV